MMEVQEKNIETVFKIVNKRPYDSKQEQQRKKDAVRADLYQIYKKYNH